MRIECVVGGCAGQNGPQQQRGLHRFAPETLLVARGDLSEVVKGECRSGVQQYLLYCPMHVHDRCMLAAYAALVRYDGATKKESTGCQPQTALRN